MSLALHVCTVKSCCAVLGSLTSIHFGIKSIPANNPDQLAVSNITWKKNGSMNDGCRNLLKIILIFYRPLWIDKKGQKQWHEHLFIYFLFIYWRRYISYLKESFEGGLFLDQQMSILRMWMSHWVSRPLFSQILNDHVIWKCVMTKSIIH